VNLCQPCYCDKVCELAFNLISVRSNFHSFPIRPHSLTQPRTDAISILLSASFFFLSFFPSLLLPFDFLPSLSSKNSSLVLYSSSVRTQKKPSPRARTSTALIATIGTAGPVSSSAGASIAPIVCAENLSLYDQHHHDLHSYLTHAHAHLSIHPTCLQPYTCGLPSLLSCISRLTSIKLNIQCSTAHLFKFHS